MKKPMKLFLVVALLTTVSLTGCGVSSSSSQSTTAKAEETTAVHTTANVTTIAPTTAEPTTEEATTVEPTTEEPTTEKPTEAPKVKKYNTGQHKVGEDIPSGRYVVYTTTGKSAYYCISSDANGKDIIANNNFKTQNYIEINDGEYLELSRCAAVAFEDKEAVDTSSGYLKEGQYLVGVDFPAGEYKLENNDEDKSAYYAITGDANGKDIIANDNFKGGSYVSVSDGQYLEINRCKLILS